MLPEYYISNIHNIGSREGQEDSFGISDINDTRNGIMFVLADGMGGMANGKLVISTAVSFFLNKFMRDNIKDNIGFLKETAYELNDEILDINEKNGVNGGTTLIVCILKDDVMDYISIGDSRLAIYKNDQLTKINTEHNYEQVLKKLYDKGEITLEELNNNKNKAALTSYIGTPNELKIDFSEDGIKIDSGDKIILMSDGIFGTLSDEMLEDRLRQNVYKAAECIENNINDINKRYQDNFTAIVIEKNR